VLSPLLCRRSDQNSGMWFANGHVRTHGVTGYYQPAATTLRHYGDSCGPSVLSVGGPISPSASGYRLTTRPGHRHPVLQCRTADENLLHAVRTGTDLDQLSLDFFDLLMSPRGVLFGMRAALGQKRSIGAF
jgi:hypothetical protein